MPLVYNWTCDDCGNPYDGDEWWEEEDVITELVLSDWHLTPTSQLVCGLCWADRNFAITRAATLGGQCVARSVNVRTTSTYVLSAGSGT